MKKFFKFGCLGFIALLIIGLVINLASGGEDSKSNNGSNKVTKQEKTEKVAKIGDTLKVGGVEFKVNGVSTSKNVGGQLGVNSKGTFLIVDVTVTNKGSKAITVDSTFFKLVAGSKEYEADSAAGVYANESRDFFLQQVNPDVTTTGKVVFDVTDDVIKNPDLLLNVQTGVFGTEQGKIKIAQ